jgi:hypothetical protein
MDPRDAALVLDEARKWAGRGLLSSTALEVLEREYGTDAAREGPSPDRPGVGLSILYALAGVLLGAACVAVPVLLHSPETVIPWWMLGLGLPLLAAGIVWSRFDGPSGIVDALLIGSLVPLTIMGLPNDNLGRYLAPVSLVAALAVTWLRRDAPAVPILGSIATFASAGILSHRLMGNFFDTQAGSWLWLGLGLVQMAATLLIAPRPWRTPVAALLCAGLVIPFVLGLDRALPSHDARFYELLVGAFELGILLIGLGIRERGLVLGAAVVIAIDAIAYAFETNVLLGIGVLLGVAVLLIVLASTLKRGRRIAPAP